ncbi:MAG TPA: hypothetical protein PKK85_01090 [Methanobacteriaceae archaeon]|nr:hypothetical protein [Methanobacteriaceae archaeon]
MYLLLHGVEGVYKGTCTVLPPGASQPPTPTQFLRILSGIILANTLQVLY